MWAMLVVVGILGTFGPTPGSLEGIFFTVFPLSDHFRGLPEVLLQAFFLFDNPLLLGEPSRKKVDQLGTGHRVYHLDDIPYSWSVGDASQVSYSNTTNRGVLQEQQRLSQGKLLRMVAVVRLCHRIPALMLILFLPAGTFAYWEAWVYLGVLFIPMTLVLASLLKNDPDCWNADADERKTSRRKNGLSISRCSIC